MCHCVVMITVLPAHSWVVIITNDLPQRRVCVWKDMCVCVSLLQLLSVYCHLSSLTPDSALWLVGDKIPEMLQCEVRLSPDC